MHPIVEEMLQGFLTIFKAPSNDWSVLWLLMPIILFWMVLEIYFDRHKKEKLGWNTALGNGLSLFWVAISCVRFIFAQEWTWGTFWRTFWIFVIFAYSVFIIYMSFSHKIKEKLAYKLASPSPIYYLSIVIVFLSYGVLEFSWIILLDLFILYILIIIIEIIVRHFVPEAPDDSESSDSMDSGSDSFESSGSDQLDSGNSNSGSSDPFGGDNSSGSDPFGGSSSSGNSDPFADSGNSGSDPFK